MSKISSELILNIENYQQPIQILNGLDFKEKDKIRMIEFYSNSRYLGGQNDEKGRPKPFMNIVNGICDVENAAVDIDTKDITVTADNQQNYVLSFLLSKDLYQWMKDANFGETLNEMRDTHTRYGSLLVKKCIYTDEKGKKHLKIDVPEWKNVVSSQTDKENSPIVELHYMSPSKLLKQTEWSNVKDEAQKAMKAGGGKQIQVYEIHGDFPVSYYKEAKNELAGEADEKEEITDDDETTFTHQLYYFSGGVDSNLNSDGKWSGALTLMYAENNTDKVYKHKARKKKAGRSWGVGVLEEGEEAQVQTNNAVLKQSRAMEYTSKVIGQTASKKLKGRNLLNEVEDGQILEHDENKPIEALQLMPSGGLGQYSTLINQWYLQFQRATSAFDSQRGEQQSDIPYRGQALAVNQSGSVFNDTQESLGIFYAEIINDWVLPFLSAQLNKEHILAHDFSVEELQWMDKNFAIHESNKKIIEKILNGEEVTPEMQQAWTQENLSMIKKTQSTRFIQILKDQYKDLKPKVTVNITGEQRNKAATLETLNNIITLLTANPNATKDPFLMQLTTRIIELSGAGISPVSLLASIQESAKQQMAIPEATKSPIKVDPAKLEANPNG